MNWFSNLKLRAKLLMSFAVVIVLAVCVGIIGIYSMRTIDDRSQAMYNNMTVPLAQIAEIAETFQRVRINLRDMVFAKTAEDERYYLDRVRNLTDKIAELSADFETSILSQEMQDLYDDFVATRQVFAGPREEVIALALAEDRDEEAIAILNGAAFDAAQAEMAAIDAIKQTKVRHARERDVANQELAQRASFWVEGVLAVSVLIALALGWYVARLIATPVAELNAAAQQVAQGKTDVSVKIHQNDEVGSLASAFNTMVGNIKDNLESVRQAATKAEIAVKEAEAAQTTAETQQAYLAQSVEEMLHAMDRFADGDLTVQLSAKKDDEIGRLYDGFNRAVETLRSTLQDLSIAINTSNQTATDISSATDQLAAASHEQSAQSVQVAAAVEQMTASIIENARSSNEATTVVRTSGEQAHSGGEVVDETVQKIREIAEVFSASATSIERLANSSQEIGRIVSLINEIAEQTNLLALNAAIEAARAGEHGRSFAVVADEVRGLASRTREATSEIAHMIDTIQSETETAVQAMEQGTREVKLGLTLADNAGNALKSIVHGAQETEQTVAQIAAATEEQSATSEEIARSVEAISKVANEAAEEVNRIAEATTGLQGLTEEIQSRIARFNIGSSAVVADGHPVAYAGDGATSSVRRLRLRAA